MPGRMDGFHVLLRHVAVCAIIQVMSVAEVYLNPKLVIQIISDL